MKKQSLYLIIAVFFMAQFGFSANSSNDAVINGTISVSETKIQEGKLTELIMYGVKDGKPVVATTAKLNALNEFSFSMPISTPGFYYIDYGQFKSRRQLIRLYLEPKLNIDLKITNESYVLAGKNIGKNDLVQKANDIYNDFSFYSNRMRNTSYKDFYPFLDGGLAQAETFKNSINTKDKTFNSMLKLAVDTDVQELSYMFFRMPRAIFPEKGNYPAVMKQWLTDKKITNPDILKLANGVSLMDGYFNFRGMCGTKAFDKMEYFRDVTTEFSDPALREVFIRTKIVDMELKIEEYEKIKPIVKPYLTSESSKEFMANYEKELHKNVGEKGLEFTYKDVNDKPVSFSDFRGKYVYVDLWATWCGPCKAEIPHMKKMEEDYHGKNIVFMSVSMDKPKDNQKWKDYVAKEQLKGIQIMVDKDFESEIAKTYNVRSIPRFLLFDPQGKIVSTNALRPSEPALRDELDKLLKG